MYSYGAPKDSSDSAMEQPLCWTHKKFDRSPAELLWVESPNWGELDGKLLHLSYGHGRVEVVPHENLNGQLQGGMVRLPIADFPTGIMRGRFHPQNKHLYLCGMSAWASSQPLPGGFYRLRATGKPMHIPVSMRALKKAFPHTPGEGFDMLGFTTAVLSILRPKAEELGITDDEIHVCKEVQQ